MSDTVALFQTPDQLSVNTPPPEPGAALTWWINWWVAEANISVKYRAELRHRYSNRDRVLRGMLALTSSSSVAGLTFWASYPEVWEGMVALTAFLAVLNPLLGYSKIISDLAEEYGRWVQIRERFQNLLDRILFGGKAVHVEDYENVRSDASMLYKQEVDLSWDPNLWAKVTHSLGYRTTDDALAKQSGGESGQAGAAPTRPRGALWLLVDALRSWVRSIKGSHPK